MHFIQYLKPEPLFGAQVYSSHNFESQVGGILLPSTYSASGVRVICS